MAFFGGYYSDYDSNDSDEDEDVGFGGCSCGMCGFNPFGLMLMGGFLGGFGAERNPWRNRREKSNAAQAREAAARRKFNQIKDKVDEVLQEKMKVGLI
jgi:hypothetical protein